MRIKPTKQQKSKTALAIRSGLAASASRDYGTVKATPEQIKRGQAILRQTGGPSFPEADHSFFASPRLRLGFNQLLEPYRQSGLIYSVIRALAGPISQVPFKIMTGSRKDPRQVEEGEPGGEWQELFQNPNPFLSEAQFKEALVVWLSLSGGPMIVEEGRNEGAGCGSTISSPPVSVSPLNSTSLSGKITASEGMSPAGMKFLSPNASSMRGIPRLNVSFTWFSEYPIPCALFARSNF